MPKNAPSVLSRYETNANPSDYDEKSTLSERFSGRCLILGRQTLISLKANIALDHKLKAPVQFARYKKYLGNNGLPIKNGKQPNRVTIPCARYIADRQILHCRVYTQPRSRLLGRQVIPPRELLLDLPGLTIACGDVRKEQGR